MRNWNLVLSITLTSLLSACATKDSIIPTPEHDMKTVYDRHMKGVGSGKVFDERSVLRRPLIEPDVQMSQYVRTEKTQLESNFKTLPNPVLYMFVSPHLAGDSEVPVPGYITQFKMWEKDHYALPGEISDIENAFGGEK